MDKLLYLVLINKCYNMLYITLRYKGNFRAAPNFLATPTKEFKELLKR